MTISTPRSDAESFSLFFSFLFLFFHTDVHIIIPWICVPGCRLQVIWDGISDIPQLVININSTVPLTPFMDWYGTSLFFSNRYVSVYYSVFCDHSQDFRDVSYPM